MMCMAAVTFSACSDDDDDDKSINVPEPVVQALKQKYPSATGIEWEQKGAYFVADCWLDGKESNIWFDPNANWLMTESEIFWNDVPEAVHGNKKCDLIPMKELLPLTGYIRGGCTPIGMKKTFSTYIHESCLNYPYIYISAGQRGLQLKLDPNDLIKEVHAEVCILFHD